MKKRHVYRLIPFMVAIVLLGGCQSMDVRPLVVDRVHPATVQDGQHVVREGESLYLIAWRYHRDFRELAAINRIKPPYRIYRGQLIYLSKNSKKRFNSKHKNKILAITPKRHVYTDLAWKWPATGQIISDFSNENKQKNGIDISAREGATVRAAATGKVVYSGSGLRGLGRLIIIKHNDQYLSAYAHNSRLIVKEGDTVKVGQKIAEMGRSDTNQVKLHFEIRKNGVPVDPMMFLAME